jgi:membrane associated rhomboid family serine protease
MLSDRTYMRSPESGSRPGFLVWLLGVVAAVFVLQREAFFGSDALFRFGALSSSGLRSGEFWTPLTYTLLHGSLTHLLLNGLGLFFLGRALQPVLGSSRLAWLTAAGALGGAALWFACNFQSRGHVVGASGVVMAYLTVFACLQPRRPMTFLLFFVIPLTIQPRWLVLILGGIDLLGLITQELPGSGSLYGVAHSAHLGGLAAGWLFHRIVLAPRTETHDIEPPAWIRKRAAPKIPAFSVNVGPAAPTPPPSPLPSGRDALRIEVDRILDKINLHGFGSLTESEKRVLDEARQQLSHR